MQTFLRLNRAHSEKHDVLVLDFQNNTETITLAFSDYYRTTVLSEETDPNRPGKSYEHTIFGLEPDRAIDERADVNGEQEGR